MNTSLEEKLAKKRASRPVLPKKMPLRMDQIAAYYGIDEPSFDNSSGQCLSDLESTRGEIMDVLRSTSDAQAMRDPSQGDAEQSDLIPEEAKPQSSYSEARDSSRFTFNGLSIFDPSQADAEQSDLIPEESTNQHHVAGEATQLVSQELSAINMMETPKSSRRMSRRSGYFPQPMEIDRTPTPPRHVPAKPAIARLTFLFPRLPHYLTPTIASQGHSKVVTPISGCLCKSKLNTHARTASSPLSKPSSPTRSKIAEHAPLLPTILEFDNEFDAVPMPEDVLDGPEDGKDSTVQSFSNMPLVVNPAPALPAKKKKITQKFVLQKPMLIKPESPKPGLRRSSRTRVRALRVELNERPIYEIDEDGCQKLVGVSSTLVNKATAEKYMTVHSQKQKEKEGQKKKAPKKNKKKK